jgi:hypothetical protein
VDEERCSVALSHSVRGEIPRPILMQLFFRNDVLAGKLQSSLISLDVKLGPVRTLVGYALAACCGLSGLREDFRGRTWYSNPRMRQLHLLPLLPSRRRPH